MFELRDLFWNIGTFCPAYLFLPIPRQILAESSLKILAESSLKILAEYVIEHREIALIERVWHGTSSNITHKRGSDCARSV